MVLSKASGLQHVRQFIMELVQEFEARICAPSSHQPNHRFVDYSQHQPIHHQWTVHLVSSCASQLCSGIRRQVRSSLTQQTSRWRNGSGTTRIPWDMQLPGICNGRVTESYPNMPNPYCFISHLLIHTSEGYNPIIYANSYSHRGMI